MRRRPPHSLFPPLAGFPFVHVIVAAGLAVLLGMLLLSVPVGLIAPGMVVALLAAGLAALLRLHWQDGQEAGPPPVMVQPAPLDDLPVAVMRFDGQGDPVEANGEARGMLGLGPQDLPPVTAIFADLGRPVRGWLGDIAAGRLPAATEVLALRGEGERFLQMAARPDGAGGVLAVLQDATAIKRLEAQVAQGQKMQSIGQLAGGIAHDFNNLLTAITGHCDLLLLRHEAGDADHADLVQISQNANRAGALVAQLLAFSRKQTLLPQLIDLQDTLSDLTHLLDRLLGERVRLELVHARHPVAIRADRRQFEQVVINLAVNARDAMPEGGVVTVETCVMRLDEDMQRDGAVVPRGEHAVIRVIDTGEGIPPDRIGKIFEPFFTTKRVGEGTGLGLSTAYGIVKQSGGFIFVRSTPGEGTRFELWFPLCTEAAVPAPPVAKADGGRRAEGVVLLVEDEAPVRAFAARALRLCGHVVLEAGNGEEALDLLEDEGLKVDVFVTDVVMPGLDGPGWVLRALAARPAARTVFISGYAEEALADMQTRVPNSVFLPKPFSLAQLTGTVQEQMVV
ncbi:response regulator [Rhodobacteraceae bacterium HSP-20]|uniref:histidine kinase n=1 Tax=Paragemmobacter amnigenus TaxID=2852097 RepID=A0ABS6J3M5_9RHOB|nr:response regulator [Rhodobacter amnigenus]MBV4389593.1 response regulator [Rhodobacter amnigenus]